MDIISNNKKYLLKRYSVAFQLWNSFLGLYALLFVTQGHPTWESIMILLQCKHYCKRFKPTQGTIFKIQNQYLIPLRKAALNVSLILTFNKENKHSLHFGAL